MAGKLMEPVGKRDILGVKVCWDVTVEDFEFSAKRSGFIYMQWRGTEYSNIHKQRNDTLSPMFQKGISGSCMDEDGDNKRIT